MTAGKVPHSGAGSRSPAAGIYRLRMDDDIDPGDGPMDGVLSESARAATAISVGVVIDVLGWTPAVLP